MSNFVKLVTSFFKRANNRNGPTLTARPVIPPGVPDYVIKYAPVVYLHSKDDYLPSDISAHLANTTPKQEFQDVAASGPSPLTLENLDALNNLGKGGEDIYLTSKDDISEPPAWIRGVKPDSEGRTKDAVTCAVIVVDKGNGVTDAFYMHFYTFNWGGIVLGKNLGNHVGDWEHVTVRFKNGTPETLWLSQHSGGQAFTYKALDKDRSGLRPIVYSARGSHAIYATTGLHNHDNADFHLPTPGFVNDYTEAGILWDPVLSAFWYSWQPSPSPPSPPPTSTTRDTATLGTFTPYENAPVGYLYFEGRWGDFRYPQQDERQDEIFKLAWKYDSSPTEPAFKELGQKEV